MGPLLVRGANVEHVGEVAVGAVALERVGLPYLAMLFRPGLACPTKREPALLLLEAFPFRGANTGAIAGDNRAKPDAGDEELKLAVGLLNLTIITVISSTSPSQCERALSTNAVAPTWDSKSATSTAASSDEIFSHTPSLATTSEQPGQKGAQQ